MSTKAKAKSVLTEPETSSARKRTTKRDEAIRKKAETELAKRNSPKIISKSSKAFGNKIPGSVASLKPSTALVVKETTTIQEAAQLMAAKRSDSVLVLNEQEKLVGIFTSKDLAYRVVAENLDSRTIPVSNIMTKSPFCISSKLPAQEALNLMIEKKFRHLPIMNDQQDIIGILDIAKCLFNALNRMEKFYSSSKQLSQALLSVEKQWGAKQTNELFELFHLIKDRISCPTLSSILKNEVPLVVNLKSSVKEAANLMKANHKTSVLVMEENSIAGIFTSKDIVLRVVAAGLDPSTCRIIRVMTPHPETAPPTMTILEALKLMQEGRFMNLPIVDELGQILGIIDILTLTMAALNLIQTLETNEAEGPVWNRFWDASFLPDHQSELSSSHQPAFTSPSQGDRLLSEVFPHESASLVDEQTPSQSITSNQFKFKFKSPNQKVYRFTCERSYFSLLEQIATRLKVEGVEEPFQYIDTHGLSYYDEESDLIQIHGDQDLFDGIELAIKFNWDRLMLTILTPDEPVPTPPPPTKTLPKPDEDNIASNDSKTSESSLETTSQGKKPIDQLILPSAIIGSVVIVLLGTFLIVKFTKK